MSSMVVEKSFHVNTTPQDCMTAFKNAISELDRYDIRTENTALGLIEAHKKIGIVGIGENITFTVKADDSGSQILITVAPKGTPYLLWRTHCEKVIQQVVNTFSEQIEKFFTD